MKPSVAPVLILSPIILLSCATSPRSGDINIEAKLERGLVPSGQTSDMFARIRLTAAALEDVERPPIHLALVIDTSGSMQGQAIEDARQAAELVVDAMSDSDRLALVTFDSQARVVIELSHMTDKMRTQARNKIAKIEATGTTALAKGLDLGLQELSKHKSANALQHVLLLSDGLPNNPGPVVGLAAKAKKEGFVITSLGLGAEFDEDLLAKAALGSGGRFHFIETSDEVERVFKDEVAQLQRVVARKVRLQLRAGPSVQLARADQPQESAGTALLTLNLGEMSEGQERDVIVRVTAPGRRHEALVELFDVNLTFTDAVASTGSHQKHQFVGVRSSSVTADVAKAHDREIRVAAIQKRAAGAVVRATALARGRQLAQGQAELTSAIQRLRVLANEMEESRLRQTILELEEVQEDLPEVAKEAARIQPSATYDRMRMKRNYNRSVQEVMN